MKKIFSISTILVMVMVMVACEKDQIAESSEILTPTPTRTDVRWLFARDTMWAVFNNGDTLPAQQVTSTPQIRAERIYKEEGTNGIAPTANLSASFVNNIATSFPYNYGINNEVYVNHYVTLTVGGVTYDNVPAAETLKVRGWHTVDNMSSAPFHEQSHTTYTLLNSLGEVVIINGDSVTCRQDFAVREVIPTVVHDTVRIVEHDTTVVVVREVVHDTVINGLWVDSVVTRRHVVVSHHHLTTRTTDVYTPTTATTGSLETRCTNRTDSVFTERMYIWYSDNSVDSTRTRNWSSSHNWQKVWTRSVAIYGTNPGSGRATMSGNVADFGGGFRVVLGNPVVTTSPAGYNPTSTDCNHSVTYWVASATGVTEKGAVAHGATADTTQGFIPMSGNPPTPPTVVRVDTIWGACTTATVWYQATPAEQVKATVGKTYTLERVWSDSSRTTVAGGTATTTYTWNIIRNGQPTNAMISILPANGNPVSFGGGAFTEELTQVGSQRFCPLQWTSAVLTSNGTVWSGSYAGTTVTVTVPETFVTPTPWEDVVYMVVTDGYEQQIFSAQSQRHQFLEIITYNSATGYKKFYKDVTNMPLTMPTRSSCDDSTSLTSAQYNFYVSSASNGFYATQVIPHNGNTTLYDGVVGSQELSNWWQLTFRLTNNTQAYVMGGSSWTMAGDNGRNALRGIADTTNHTITVDYGSGNTRTWAY